MVSVSEVTSIKKIAVVRQLSSSNQSIARPKFKVRQASATGRTVLLRFSPPTLNTLYMADNL